MKSDEYLNAKDRNWWIETSVDNYPAIKVYEKLGFVRDNLFPTQQRADKCVFVKRI